MNMTLKVLTAIALVTITIAAGIFAIKILTTDSSILLSEKKVPTSSSNASVPDIVEIPIVQPERSKPKFSDEIVIKEDDPLQPNYVPVNQPAFLQNIREEGKTYHSRVMGKLDGQASKKDWGIRGTAYFTYIYGVESIGKIVKNDGVTIIEERTFRKGTEDVIVSKYDVGFELPSDLGIGLATIECLFGGDGTISLTVVNALNQIKIPFNDSMFNKLREKKCYRKHLIRNV